MGHIFLRIQGVAVTASAVGEHRQDYVGWYLSPLLGWLAENWVPLLHEERYAWEERTAAAAVVACGRVLDWVSDDPGAASEYAVAQAWYARHGIRSAAVGGLFPDLYIRRVADDIELSWSGEPPEFAPTGFLFESGVGRVRLPVSEFALPLWELLRWAAAHPPEADASFEEDIRMFQSGVRELRGLETPSLCRRYVEDGLFGRARSAFEEIERLDLFDHGEWVAPEVPCIDTWSPAVAMFGGVSPELSENDVRVLRNELVEAHGGDDSERLAPLVESRREAPIGVPYRDGERFAAELLEDLELATFGNFVDVRDVCSDLGIAVETVELETDSIRGVAFAGAGFSPRILVNPAHYFNENDSGQRFTIAHELCHILFDRTRARRLAHVSGRWASPAIEKRANAFAAYLLMPPPLVREILAGSLPVGVEEVKRLAAILKVNQSAIVEHLFNLAYIDEVDRERLRVALRPD